MFRDLDAVVLTQDQATHGLKAGDVGAVVHRYPGNEAHKVEFVTAEGRTVAVFTLRQADIRPIRGSETLPVRDVQRAA